MTVCEYTRLQLAERQLEAAIGLFMVGRDRFAVVTLAGAADVILSQLAFDKDKANFTDTLMEEAIRNGAAERTRAEHGRAINDVLFINDMKHMDKEDDGFVDMDPEECAFGAIMKAMVNYIAIVGRKHPTVAAFFFWVSKNMDPKKYNLSGDPNWKPEDAQDPAFNEGEKKGA
ncbi:hypothetical protein SAMN03159335_07338 [Burkholderia cepacia]|uniref:hypothetical protein n=1 Tax=Burkholderia cepacia TaxID=292 RepID=UPI0008C6A679|nr:hypothetical protein [Burkholderia cepacia]SEU45510.1 hypothetical protein SAMN03159335_07338 [Burkholderia cepacia]